MDPRQTRATLGFMVFVLAAWVISTLLFSYREPAPPVSSTPLSFDGRQAFRFTQEFVTRFPRRVLGSFESRRSTGYIQQHLESLGYEISYTHFNAVVAGHSETGRNVLGFRPGKKQEVISVVAHYDTAPTTLQGAMDNGSGVGVMLELARVFSGAAPERSLLFIASDGGEWGMLGSLDLATSYPELHRIVGLISLDYVPVGEFREIVLGTGGFREGYSPPWLRETARAAALIGGLRVSEPSGLREHLQRALPYPRSDQGPFLAAGIPAINLGGASEESRREWEVFHSSQDVIENMKEASFEVYGKTAERMLRSIDARDSAPPPPRESLRANDGQYLSPSLVRLLHYLSFLPFLVILYFHLMNHQKYLSPGRVWREALEYIGVFSVLSFAYAGILLFRTLRMLPRYSLYPGAVKDPVLDNPRWDILTWICVIGLAAALIFYFSSRLLFRKMPRPDFYISKSVLMTVMLVIVLVAVQYNSYWASTFLVLPAWVWSLVGMGKGIGGRTANRVSIVAAGVPYYLVLVSAGGALGLGWKILWHEILAMSTYLYRIEGVILTLATISLGVRYLFIQSYTRED